MAKSYQLVAWTDNGQVKMLPSEIATFIHKEQEYINSIADRVRYKTPHEVQDLLKVSYAYEKLGLQLLALSRIEDAFKQFEQAALCCTASGNNWRETEWGPDTGKATPRPLLCDVLPMQRPCPQAPEAPAQLGGKRLTKRNQLPHLCRPVFRERLERPLRRL